MFRFRCSAYHPLLRIRYTNSIRSMQRQRLLLPNDQGALSFTSIPRRKFLSSTTGNSRFSANTTNQKGNDIINDDDDRIITTKQARNAAAAIKSKVNLYGAFSTDDMMDIHDKNGDNEGIHFDHSDYNDYYPDFDQIDVLYSHIPIFTQTPPESPKPTATTTTTTTTTKEKAKTKKTTNSKTSSSNKTPSKKRTKPSVTKSPLRQKMEDTIQTAFDDRMAQLNVYHDKCQTCPICQNEFLGGRYFMLHHLFHDYACTKDVPTEVLQKLIEQKEAQDGVKYDDIVLEPRGPDVKKKKKKVLTKIESRKLHRKKDKKRTKEFRQWHKQRDERYGSDSDSGNNNYTTTDK